MSRYLSTKIMTDLIQHDRIRSDQEFAKSIWTCPICIEELHGKEFVRFHQCGHYCCKECFKQYCPVEIADGDVQLNLHRIQVHDRDRPRTAQKIYTQGCQDASIRTGPTWLLLGGIRKVGDVASEEDPGYDGGHLLLSQVQQRLHSQGRRCLSRCPKVLLYLMQQVPGRRPSQEVVRVL